MWKPYKIIKTIPRKLETQDNPDAPTPKNPKGDLRFNKDIGWHYRYYKPFKISGKPWPTFPMGSRSSEKTASGTKPRKRTKTGTKWTTKRKANRPKLIVRLVNLRPRKIGMPDIRMKRIDEQEGFRTLKRLLGGKSGK